MSALVIVAIPEQDDRVWKISSEKVPHLTLLYLGENVSVEAQNKITEFVAHAATMSLSRFFLPVDQRGELGDDKADVLFFKKGRYDYKAIRDFRNVLLKDNSIKTAYLSSDQYENWTPHLTLGYPETPAKPGPNGDDRIYDVCFDRIAVWTGDYEGPEFDLTDKWDEIESMEEVNGTSSPAYHEAQQRGEEFLEHFGVKGMKWGVRKSEDGGSASPGKAKTAVKKIGKGLGTAARVYSDAQFENRAETGEAARLVADSAASAYRRTDLPAVKARHGDYAKLTKRATKPFSKEAVAYRKDARETYIKRLEMAANSFENASGTRQYTIRERGWELPAQGGDLPTSKTYWDVTTRKKLTHAAEDNVDLSLEVIFDDEGYIVDLKPVEDNVAHTLDMGEEFLEHYGVKGMKWGVRNEHTRSEATAGQATAAAYAGTVNLLDKGFRKNTSKKTQFLVSTVGPVAMLDAGVRSDMRKIATDRKIAVGDQNWAKDVRSGKAWSAVNNQVADHFNKNIDAINQKHKGHPDWSTEDYRNPTSASYKAYMKDINKLTKDSIDNAVKQMDLENPSRTKKVMVVNNGPGSVAIRVVNADKIRHAADDEPTDIELDVKYIFNPNGTMKTFTVINDPGMEAAHTALAGEAFLEHYGVKGMKWGVRNAHERLTTRSTPMPGHPTAVSKVPGGKKRKTKIQVEGGHNLPASEDALKVAAAKATLKKSGPAALSNKELQDVANRLRLEDQVKQLTKSKGQKFVQRQFETEAQAAARLGLKKGKDRAFS